MDTPETSNTQTETTEPAVYTPGTAIVRPAEAHLLKVRDDVMAQMQTLRDRLSNEEEKKIVEKFIRFNNPNKRGREEMPVKWTIPVLRIVQGMTRERPQNSQVGDLYTSTQQLLSSPVQVTALYMHEANRMFNMGGGEDAPSCFSPDARLGDPYGWCHACPHLPKFKNSSNKATSCDNGFLFTVLTSDLKVLIVEFYKTSRRVGVKFDDYLNNSEEMWDHWFQLKSDKMAYDGKEWYVFKVIPTNTETPIYVRETASILHTMVATQRKMMLQEHYDQVHKATAAMEAVAENVPSGTVIPDEDPTDIL